jgi:hypothetical protein
VHDVRRIMAAMAHSTVPPATHQALQKAHLSATHYPAHSPFQDTVCLASSPRVGVWAFIWEHSSCTRAGNSLRGLPVWGGAAQEWIDWCSSGKRPTSLIPYNPNEVRGTPPIVFYLTTQIPACSARLAEVEV